MRITLKALAVCVVTMAVITGGAVAAATITGKNVKNNSLSGADIKNIRGGDIANGSITNSDIKRGTIRLDKLSSGTQALIRKAGTPGANGAPGAPGSNAAGVVGENWSIIERNQIGSSVADLRTGPYVPGATAGTISAPPFGKGSLGMQVAAGEKAVFGNEIDFQGKNVADLTKVGFRVFQTGESKSLDPGNLPNITFEIDPRVTGTTDNYSSMNFVPAALSAGSENKWSGFIDGAAASGGWWLTGSEGTTTGCTAAATCSLTALKAALVANHAAGAAATIKTAGVNKGTDANRFEGAVDGLQINNQLFDFESYGVVTTTVP